jgi:hypothetical protein
MEMSAEGSSVHRRGEIKEHKIRRSGIDHIHCRRRVEGNITDLFSRGRLNWVESSMLEPVAIIQVINVEQ